MKDLYTENLGQQWKESKEDTNRSKIEKYFVLQITKMNIVKMHILPKVIYRFSAIPIKIPMTFFTEIKQTILKLVGNHKKTQNNQSNLEKEGQRWRQYAPWSLTILSNCNSWTIQYWHTNRHMAQQNRIENLETNPRLYG